MFDPSKLARLGLLVVALGASDAARGQAVSPTPRGPSTPSAANPAARGDADAKLRIDTDGRITVHMDDLDVRRAIEILSRQGGLNIMVAPGVSGRVTANLEGASLDQALTAILKLANLTAKREGRLIYVYSAEEIKQLATSGQVITTRVYRLNYIRATDLMTMVEDLLSADGTMTATPPSREGISESPTFSSSGGPSGGGGASAGGGGAGGARGGGGTGTTGGDSLAGGDVVIVRDYPANLKAVDDIVTTLDVQPVQVLVEAVIVSVELTRTQQLGVNYAVVDNLGRTLGTVGSGTDLVPNSGFNPAKLLTVPVDATAAAAAAAGRLNGGTGDGGFNSATNGIKFGFVSKNNSGFIRALETLGEVKVLASPRLLVLNKQRAEIQLGQRLGYRTITQNLTSTVQQVQFLNTGTLLRLRPFVSSDGMVRMEIHPERSSGSVQNDVPSSNTSEVTTNVMIPDGTTLVIGGLIENTDDYLQQGLPGLDRVPLIGALGLKTKNKAKRELIVLLTPHIWRSGLGADGCFPSTAGTATAGESAARTASTRPAAVARTSDPAVRPATARPSGRPGATSHVVRASENFWTLSRLHYGDGRYYLALWAANRELADRPESLHVGDKVRIPPVDDLDPALVVDVRSKALIDGTPVATAVQQIRSGATTRRPSARIVGVDRGAPPPQDAPPSRRTPRPSTRAR